MKKIFYFTLGAVLLASCSSDEGSTAVAPSVPPPSDADAIVLTASMGEGTTRGSQDVQTAAFDAGEQVNVECTPSGSAQQSVTYRAAAADGEGRNMLTPYSRALSWPATGTVSLRAYYPSTVGSSQTTFSVKADQSDDADYKLSDLMYASPVSDQARTDAVALTFHHALSKIVVNLTAGSGVTAADLASCEVAVQAARTVDITNGVASGASASDPGWITLGTGAATAGIIVPQTIDGSATARQFLRVTMAGRTLYYMLSVNKTFAERMKYTYTLRVSANAIVLASAVIGEWGSGNTDSDTITF